MGALLIGLAAILAALVLMPKAASGLAVAARTGGSLTIDQMIDYAASKYGVSRHIIKAVAMTESSLNPNAVNPKDPSYGLMQIMPILAEDFGIVRDYHNPTAAEIAMIKEPQTNLRIGAWHLHRLLDKYSFDVAIQMYNVGIKGYNDGKRAPDYLAKVTRYHNEYSIG